jgi:hypothetical protein
MLRQDWHADHQPNDGCAVLAGRRVAQKDTGQGDGEQQHQASAVRVHICEQQLHVQNRGWLNFFVLHFSGLLIAFFLVLCFPFMSDFIFYFARLV